MHDGKHVNPPLAVCECPLPVQVHCSETRRQSHLQITVGVEVHHFQHHTEVRWFSLGPSVRRIVEQWDCICSFEKNVGKDCKSASYKRVTLMFNNEEGKKAKAQLKFISNVSPVFEDLLTIIQKNFPKCVGFCGSL